MPQFVKDFVVAVTPALKEAFVHAAKVSAFIVLSAALAAATAYLQGKTSIDPTVLLAWNVLLAGAKKALDTLNK